MTKILIASNTSWFVYNFFNSAIREFIERGNEVLVLAPKDSYSQRLVEMGCEYSEVKIERSSLALTKELRAVSSILRTFIRYKPNIVLNFTSKVNIYSTLVAKTLGIPTVNNIAGLGTIFLENGIKSRLGRLALRISQPLADHVIFQNYDDRNAYISGKFVKSYRTSRVNGIGIDLEKFTPFEAEDDGVVRFILVARMLRSKGVPEFVEAAKRVSERIAQNQVNGSQGPVAEFSLLGFVDEGNPQSISERQLNEWSDEGPVKYLGATDNVYDVVKRYDCVVLPSYYQEGLPQALIEACAMSKPIITTDNVGCRDAVIDQETGYLVEPKSVSALEEAMFRMLNLTHKQRAAMGQQGRVLAEAQFGHMHVVEHYEGLINALVKK